VASSGESVARAREQCLRQYSECADACERALDMLGDQPVDNELRSELIVCAAVCRVAARALEDPTGIAGVLVEYSIEVCRRCAEHVEETELRDREGLAQACSDAAESAATLLLVA
jgi:hypothetical protein